MQQGGRGASGFLSLASQVPIYFLLGTTLSFSVIFGFGEIVNICAGSCMQDEVILQPLLHIADHLLHVQSAPVLNSPKQILLLVVLASVMGAGTTCCLLCHCQHAVEAPCTRVMRLACDSIELLCVCVQWKASSLEPSMLKMTSIFVTTFKRPMATVSQSERASDFLYAALQTSQLPPC